MVFILKNALLNVEHTKNRDVSMGNPVDSKKVQKQNNSLYDEK
jgi:hypothetical protein